MRKLIVGVSIIAAMAFLAGCGKQNADVSNTDGESNAKMEESDVKAEESLGYGIGNAKLGDTLGKEWKADQDSGSYSNGCVSASVDSDERITKLRVYFTGEDMSDCAVCYDGEIYSTVDAIVEKFGDFDSEGIIKYDDGKVVLHLEATNKDKGEYYVSLKTENVSGVMQ